MNILREYIKGLLMEVPLDDFEYVKQDDDDVMVREEVSDYFKAIPQSVNIYVAHTDDLSWAHRLPNEIQGKVSGFKSRGQTGLTDIANIGKIYPQIQNAMNPEGINLLYIYPKSYEVPAGGESFVADVNPHYLAHDLHHMLENVPGRERGEKDKFSSLIKEYLMELVWLSHGGGTMEAEQVRDSMKHRGRRLGVSNPDILLSDLFPGIKLPSGDFDLFGDIFADYLKSDGNLVLGVPEQLSMKNGDIIELNPGAKHDQRAQQYEKKFKDLFDTVLDPLKGKVALFNIFEVEHRDVERARKQAEEKIQANHGPILDHIKSMGGEFLSFSESYKEEGSFVLVFRLNLKPEPPIMRAEEFIQQFPKEAKSIEALGYEVANAAGGLWAPTVEIRLKKTNIKESVLREYVRGILLMEQVEFSGVLKLMPNANIVASTSILADQLPPEAIVLPDEKLHVTLIHQSVLKPYRKILKTMEFPSAPQAILEPAVEERVDETQGKRSWVVWLQNQDEMKAYVQEVMALLGAPAGDPEPQRRFHISIANLTGNPGDSVR